MEDPLLEEEKTDGKHTNIKSENKTDILKRTESYFNMSIDELMDCSDPDKLQKLRRLQKSAPKDIKKFVKKKSVEYAGS